MCFVTGGDYGFLDGYVQAGTELSKSHEGGETGLHGSSVWILAIVG